MSGFSYFDIQQAIYQLLSADATLTALVSGVYDFVPPDAAFPYVAIGDVTSRDWSTKTSSGSQLQFVLHVYGKEGGRKSVVEIMERLHGLLHQGSLSFASHILVAMRFEFCDVLREADGEVYHGRIRFRAYIEALAGA